MPAVFGKDSKKKDLVKNLDALYSQLQREHQISPGDFPDINRMKELLVHHDFAKFKLLDKRFLDKVRRFFPEGSSLEGHFFFEREVHLLPRF